MASVHKFKNNTLFSCVFNSSQNSQYKIKPTIWIGNNKWFQLWHSKRTKINIGRLLYMENSLISNVIRNGTKKIHRSYRDSIPLLTLWLQKALTSHQEVRCVRDSCHRQNVASNSGGSGAKPKVWAMQALASGVVRPKSINKKYQQKEPAG
jgi:hypothetical protein